MHLKHSLLLREINDRVVVEMVDHDDFHRHFETIEQWRLMVDPHKMDLHIVEVHHDHHLNMLCIFDN